ncbi:MAG: hypothetical protein LBR15_01600 [Methanobrevibacter sp.]|jgi:hypothetical protein|nr:hypothetical protein [Candidatus Methanovirga australis]
MDMNGVSVMVIAIMLFSSVGLCFADSAVEKNLDPNLIRFWSGPFEYSAKISYEDMDQIQLYDDCLTVYSGGGKKSFNIAKAKDNGAFYYVLTLNPKNSRSDDWTFTYLNSCHIDINTCMVVDANGCLGSSARFDWIIRTADGKVIKSSHPIG